MTDTKQLEQELEQLSIKHTNLLSNLKEFIDMRRFSPVEGNLLQFIEAAKCLNELEEILNNTDNLC